MKLAKVSIIEEEAIGSCMSHALQRAFWKTLLLYRQKDQFQPTKVDAEFQRADFVQRA